MPCKPQKARKLLKDEKAKVVQRTPFTIQLLYGSSGHKQEISLGVDAGTKYVGLSATTKDRVLFEAEMELRFGIQLLLANRKEYRRNRRNRKTRYRQARWLNRKRRVGWLAPSVQHKVDSHFKIIEKVHTLLPIKNITIETAQFDTKRLKELDGEDHNLNFWNVREYVLYRDKYKCQFCKGKSNDKILNVHHIVTRKYGGNSPNNLITLCETCHKKIHKDKLEHIFTNKSKHLKDAGIMNIIRGFIFESIKEKYPHTKLTYGYITKYIRIKQGLKKSHTNDARCISGNFSTKCVNNLFRIKQVRKNNRQLHRGEFLMGHRRRLNKSPKYVFGFQLFDKVEVRGQECFIFGRRLDGNFDVRLLDGTKVSASITHRKLKLIEKSKTYLWEVKPNECVV